MFIPSLVGGCWGIGEINCLGINCLVCHDVSTIAFICSRKNLRPRDVAENHPKHSEVAKSLGGDTVSIF